MDNFENFPRFLLEKYEAFRKDVPSMIMTHDFTETLINFLFPFKIDSKCTLPRIELNLAQLQLDFRNLLSPLENTLNKSLEDICTDFFTKIPAIYTDLMDNAKYFLDFDPAARSIESIILYYPGFYALTVYRLAHELCEQKIPFLPRMMSEYAHSKTGIEIHPGAEIGKNFFIDHGTGIVIGETAIVGDNVKIYQGVTLGAIMVKKNMRNTKRHPTIEDNVIIYSGSTILGGDTVIGHDSIVGGNVWLTKSIPPYSVVYHESKTVIRDGKMKDEPINFII